MKFKENTGKKVRGIKKVYAGDIKPNQFVLSGCGKSDKCLVIAWNFNRLGKLQKQMYL